MALWDRVDSEGNVEDRRSQRAGVAFGGGLVGLALMTAFVLLSGGDIGDVLQVVLQQASEQTTSQQTDRPFEDTKNYQEFASKVLGSTDEVWAQVFQGEGKTYTPPRLVLFRDITSTNCGTASSAVGPFYCPADQTIYLDETFFDAIQSQLGAAAGGDDVAQAYVIAHEVGHHVQNSTGTFRYYGDAAQSDPAISTRLELQADCYAGIWANTVSRQGIFESESEINEALSLASAIGDDKIQEKTTGQVNQETWTHGSSEQRVHWFTTGYKTGNVSACNTFESNLN